MRIYRLGDEGSVVSEIRTILSGRGLLPGAPTASDPNAAVFDDACDRAVRAFQQERGLIVDGIVGPATYRALRESSYQLGARILLYRLSAPMAGDDVATLQSRLQNLGYYTGLVDGTFGESTHNAVCLYQSEYGLASDGICGPSTLRCSNVSGSGSPADHRTRSGRRSMFAVRAHNWPESVCSSIPVPGERTNSPPV